MKPFKIAILGGGASGICAALSGACYFESSGAPYEIVVFEHMGKPLKKLLATGNGRCNFSNKKLEISNFHGSKRLAKSVLNSEFSDIEKYFDALGIKSVCEDSRIYPRSMEASSVRDALLFEAGCHNIEIKCDFNAENVNPKKANNGFLLCNEYFDSLIIACGSKAAEKQGTDGTLFPLIESFSHSFTPLSPALTAILSTDKSLKTLSGTRLFGAVSLYDEKKLLKKDVGEVQFTSNAVSGIPAFDISYLAKPQQTLFVDMYPEESAQKVVSFLKEQRFKYPKKTLECVLSGLIPQKASYAVTNRCFSSPEPTVGSLSDTALARVAAVLKAFDFKVGGTRDFPESQTASGGVSSNEINDNLMSRKASGLFFCGEILDVNGDCGGYNLHFAFASGRLAGKNAAQYSIEKGQKK